MGLSLLQALGESAVHFWRRSQWVDVCCIWFHLFKIVQVLLLESSTLSHEANSGMFSYETIQQIIANPNHFNWNHSCEGPTKTSSVWNRGSGPHSPFGASTSAGEPRRGGWPQDVNCDCAMSRWGRWGRWGRRASDIWAIPELPQVGYLGRSEKFETRQMAWDPGWPKEFSIWVARQSKYRCQNLLFTSEGALFSTNRFVLLWHHNGFSVHFFSGKPKAKWGLAMNMSSIRPLKSCMTKLSHRIVDGVEPFATATHILGVLRLPIFWHPMLGSNPSSGSTEFYGYKCNKCHTTWWFVDPPTFNLWWDVKD